MVLTQQAILLYTDQTLLRIYLCEFLISNSFTVVVQVKEVSIFIMQLLFVTSWSLLGSFSCSNLCDPHLQHDYLHLGHCHTYSAHQGHSCSKEGNGQQQNHHTFDDQHQWGNVSLWTDLAFRYSHFLGEWIKRDLPDSVYSA